MHTRIGREHDFLAGRDAPRLRPQLRRAGWPRRKCRRVRSSRAQGCAVAVSAAYGPWRRQASGARRRDSALGSFGGNSIDPLGPLAAARLRRLAQSDRNSACHQAIRQGAASSSGAKPTTTGSLESDFANSARHLVDVLVTGAKVRARKQPFGFWRAGELASDFLLTQFRIRSIISCASACPDFCPCYMFWHGLIAKVRGAKHWRDGRSAGRKSLILLDRVKYSNVCHVSTDFI